MILLRAAPLIAPTARNIIFTRTICQPSLAASAAAAVAPNNIRYRFASTMSQPSGAKGVSDAIKHDHRELESYYDRIVNSSDADEQTRFQNQFIWELARHSIAEELVVYPALEKYVDNGKQMADKDREEHQSVKEQLYNFQKLTPADSDFLPTIKGLMKDLSEHIKDEEQQDLPRLEGSLEGADSEQLARSFQRTKHFVPTQSHPSAPDKPPFETAAGLLTAPLDKLMDVFKKFPADEDK